MFYKITFVYSFLGLKDMPVAYCIVVISAYNVLYLAHFCYYVIILLNHACFYVAGHCPFRILYIPT